MCKESWCVKLGQEGVVCVRVVGSVCSTLKGGGIEKRGGETKIPKKEGATWVKVWVP